jgi:hypothetical protein
LVIAMAGRFMLCTNVYDGCLFGAFGCRMAQHLVISQQFVVLVLFAPQPDPLHGQALTLVRCAQHSVACTATACVRTQHGLLSLLFLTYGPIPCLLQTHCPKSVISTCQCAQCNPWQHLAVCMSLVATAACMCHQLSIGVLGPSIIL